LQEVKHRREGDVRSLVWRREQREISVEDDGTGIGLPWILWQSCVSPEQLGIAHLLTNVCDKTKRRAQFPSAVPWQSGGVCMWRTTGSPLDKICDMRRV
jgi:hypothetical protein